MTVKVIFEHRSMILEFNSLVFPGSYLKRHQIKFDAF
jgi:hypothetical protein